MDLGLQQLFIFFRKGILKKNLEGENSECDGLRLLGSHSDLILNPPGKTNSSEVSLN